MILPDLKEKMKLHQIQIIQLNVNIESNAKMGKFDGSTNLLKT